MDDLVTKVLPLVQQLMPGFITTLIFYWLADAKKPSQFERTIQALVGTGLIALVVPLVERLLKWIGDIWFVWAPWTPESTTAWTIALAVGLGLGLAFASNHDLLYRLARNLGLTSRASNVEWIYAFRAYQDHYIYLELLDGRKLSGYPSAWPTNPRDGHFVITDPEWVENGELKAPDGIDSILIDNVDVRMIEFREKGAPIEQHYRFKIWKAWHRAGRDKPEA